MSPVFSKPEIEDAICRKESEKRFNKWPKELRSKAGVDIKVLKGAIHRGK